MATARRKSDESSNIRDLPAVREVADTFTASNGLVLRLKKVSRILIVDAGRKIPIPKVPVMYDEDKDRTEENPNDPDYLAALQEANYERGMFTITTMLALGTELISCPKGMSAPDDEEWFDIVESLGIQFAKGNKLMRKALWLKYIGLADENDFNRLSEALLRYSGLTPEKDVLDAEQSFPGEAQRD